MRQELHDALAESQLTEGFRRRIRDRFADGRDITAGRLKEIREAITDAEAEQVAEATNPKTLLRAKLDAAMYGTLTPRDPAKPETLGITRLGHAKDGWRDGVSHPFTATVKAWPTEGSKADARKLLRALYMVAPPAAGATVTFDVLEDESEATREQYAALCRLIDGGHLA